MSDELDAWMEGFEAYAAAVTAAIESLGEALAAALPPDLFTGRRDTSAVVVVDEPEVRHGEPRHRTWREWLDEPIDERDTSGDCYELGVPEDCWRCDSHAAETDVGLCVGCRVALRLENAGPCEPVSRHWSTPTLAEGPYQIDRTGGGLWMTHRS